MGASNVMDHTGTQGGELLPSIGDAVEVPEENVGPFKETFKFLSTLRF